MTERASGVRLASVLWLVAGVLAFVAVGIRYYRRAEMSWAWVAAGVFCFAMGLSAWRRARTVGVEMGDRDRNSTP